MNYSSRIELFASYQAVYHMPTLETDEPDKSLPLALQSLFFKVSVGDEGSNSWSWSILLMSVLDAYLACRSCTIPISLFDLLNVLQLQYQSTSVNTKNLTKSFGWGTYDAFLQHDIQEMSAILCEKLEEKMKVSKQR